jgi:hypothetical protein
MSATPESVPMFPPPDKILLPLSEDVRIDDLPPVLVEYVVHLAYIHWLLFHVPLLVRRGAGGIISGGALAGAGQGVALSLLHLEDVEQLLFLHVINYSAPAHKCAVFDRRAMAEPGFVLVEMHG